MLRLHVRHTQQIEPFWNHLKKQMRERKKNYATKEELWEELQELDEYRGSLMISAYILFY